MKQYEYLIVGGGMAAGAAVKGIRELDADGPIGILTAEQEPPYQRPPLSKKLWTGKKELADIFTGLPPGVEVVKGSRVLELDPAGRRATDDQGGVYRYDKLLLATGSTPRRLPFGGDRIIYYRTVADYRFLRNLAKDQERFAVIGGNFIGSEIAAALAMQGRQATIVTVGEGIGSGIFPSDLSAFLNDYYREKGVEVLTRANVTDVTGEGTALQVWLEDGRRLEVNGVVAGIGVKPNVGLAESAGLAVDDGVVVDSQLRTSDPNIYAAGDIANFTDALLGERRRVEHEDAALSMGKAAGRVMAGGSEIYEHSPMFYSDLFELGYEAVGDLNAELETVSDWVDPFRKGVVYYLKGDQLRGVLLWDTWDQVDAARALMAEKISASRSELSGRLPA